MAEMHVIPARWPSAQVLDFPAHRIVRRADDRVAVLHQGEALIFDSPDEMLDAAARALAARAAAAPEIETMAPPTPGDRVRAVLRDPCTIAVLILLLGIPALQAIIERL